MSDHPAAGFPADLGGVCLSEQERASLESYMDAILAVNEHINLTAITDRREFWVKHILDSVHPIRAMLEGPLRSAELSPVLDLGTGGGFPLVPLAICFPDLDFVGIDSVGKKLHVIRGALPPLGVRNVRLIHGRAEDLARDAAHREKYGLVVSRAVAELRVLLEYTLPFVRVGGYFAAYKSAAVDEELGMAARSLELLGAKPVDRISYSLPNGAGERTALLFRKTKPTDRKYPRNPGIPKKSPL